MFKKTILSIVAIATLSASAFADGADIKNIKSNYDLQIACNVTKEIFQNYGGANVSFQKTLLYTKGVGKTVNVNAEDFCLRFGNFLLQDKSRVEKYATFAKQRMSWDEEVYNITFNTLGLLLNKDIRKTNLIDFSQAILEIDFGKADKLITENRQILYMDGKVYEKGSYKDDEFPKLLKHGATL